MHLFDAEDKLKKYNSVSEIIDDYFVIRLKYYDDRKRNMIANLEKELLVLVNKARYIQELLNDTIDLRKKKKQEIIDLLQEKGYNQIDGDQEYKYLVKMPMDTVSEENVDKIMKEQISKEDELQRIISTTIQQMWLSELDLFMEDYNLYQRERSLAQQGEQQVVKKKVLTGGGVKKTVKKASKIELIE
jgi:DNA topoisomerase-2